LNFLLIFCAGTIALNAFVAAGKVNQRSADAVRRFINGGGLRASRTLTVGKPKQEMISIMKERTRERLLYYLGCSAMRTVTDNFGS
jgi:hypothetical protein